VRRISVVSRRLYFTVAVAALSIVAACAPKPAPVPPPPPVVVIPPQPTPPMGASPNLAVPPLNAFGVRQTVNVGITESQILWNLRSAFNVAALNCMKPEHTAILENYKVFLKSHAKKLTSTYKAIDSEFKGRFGTGFARTRDVYETQVFNFYALPPTLSAFCDATLAMSTEVNTVKSADLDVFAHQKLPVLDKVFLDFFNSYDQYRADLAAWRQRYYPPVVVPASATEVPASATTLGAYTGPSPVPSPTITLPQ